MGINNSNINITVKLVTVGVIQISAGIIKSYSTIRKNGFGAEQQVFLSTEFFLWIFNACAITNHPVSRLHYRGVVAPGQDIFSSSGNNPCNNNTVFLWDFFTIQAGQSREASELPSVHQSWL